MANRHQLRRKTPLIPCKAASFYPTCARYEQSALSRTPQGSGGGRGERRGDGPGDPGDERLGEDRPGRGRHRAGGGEAEPDRERLVPPPPEIGHEDSGLLRGAGEVELPGEKLPAQLAPRRPLDPEAERDAPQGDAQGEA